MPSTIDIDPSRIVAPEGDSGTTPFVFTVTRSGDTSGAASAAWAVPGVDSSPIDFVGGVLPSGTVSFAPGQTSQTITVDVAGDIVQEPNKYFFVDLSAPSAGATLGNATGNGLILDDDFSGTVIYAVSGPQQLYASSSYQLEGNSGATPFVYVVQRAGNLTGGATVSWSVAGSGTSPADAVDFVGGVLPAGTVSFAPGQALASFTVEVQGDTIAKPGNDQFTVSLADPVGTTIYHNSHAISQIGNDDLPPGGVVGLSGTVDQAEGDNGATAFVFAAVREGDTSIGASFSWKVQGLPNYLNLYGGANGADFVGGVLPTGTVSFAPGQTSQNVTVEVQGDLVLEPDEAFGIFLTSTTGTTSGSQYGLATVGLGIIRNDDAYVTVQQSPSGLTYEGDVGVRPITYTVTLTGPHALPAEIAWSVAGSGATAADAADFAGDVLPSGTLTFGAAPDGGTVSQTITVNVAGDTVVEPDESFLLSLSSLSPHVTVGQPGTGDPMGSVGGTILNDDRTVSIAATDASKAEGNSGTTPFIFTITRSAISHEPDPTSALSDQPATSQEVTWSVAGYGATPVNAADFVGGILPAGTVTFLAGVLSQTISIAVAGDTTPEPDEQFQVVLTGASSGMNIVGGPAIGTVLDDDGMVTRGIITISGDIAGGEVRHDEGNIGATPYIFTVTRGGDTSVAATVAYAVTGQANALGGSDYFTGAANAADFVGGVLPSGTISFAVGQTTQSVTIAVAGDTQPEPDETFLVSLSNAAGAVLGQESQAIGTIVNDDSYVYVTTQSGASSGSQYEGNGASVAIFALHRVGGDILPGTVAYTVAGIGTDPATAADFAGGVLPSGILSFAGGVSEMFVTIDLQGNSIPEADKGFTLTLSNPSPGMALGGPVYPSSVSYTLLNDDSAISIEATSADKAEGNSGSTPFVFTVTRTAISGPDLSPAITLHWSAGGAGLNPVNAADFAGGVVPSGTVSFAEGQLSQTITVNIAGDTTPELDEQFRVVLSAAPLGTTITTAQAIGTVRNDDINFAVASNTPSQYEGNSGATPYVFTITRAGGTGTDSVGWAIIGDGAHSASPKDFVTGQALSGSVTFAPGETSQTVTIAVQGDTVVEPDEGFQMVLKGASAGTRITTGSAAATILNDDTGFSIAPLSAVKYEGDSGATPFTFTITRTGLLGAGDTVRWAVTGSGAHSLNLADLVGAVATSGTLTFAAGQSSAIVTVNIQGDTIVEPDETFQLAIGGAQAGPGNTPATITTARADATVLNDDTGLSIAADTPALAEGNSGETDFTFTVTRTGTLAGTDSVNWLTTGVAPNSAGPADFVTGAPLAGTLVFAPGQATKTITIAVQGDTYVEPDEQFMVLLRNASAGATITTNHAVATILNDDPAPLADLVPVPAPLAAAAAAMPSEAQGVSDPWVVGASVPLLDALHSHA